ncbi:MAG: alpha/beta hydrolase [Oscillospiraceae bacterium]|nr:alpha/beta hydrolase [Oscillospiraceae bacterium]
MGTIYRSAAGKQAILDLYDSQLERLGEEYHDRYVDTSFGRTHIVETGNMNGIPLLVFHGGNSTTAYTLLTCGFLMKDFHIYAADTIGHPGKSDEVSLSPKNLDYGKWASELITGLGFESMACFSGSFGAGIIAKMMCVAPKKVKRAVLYVPSGIKNGPLRNIIGMMIPMIMFTITRKDEWFVKTMLHIALSEENITDDTFETAKLSILHSKVKAGMPSDVPGKLMRKCKAPTLVMAAEKDCLFPAKCVLPRAKKIIPNCTTYLMRNRGHMNFLTAKEEQMIVRFLRKR